MPWHAGQHTESEVTQHNFGETGFAVIYGLEAKVDHGREGIKELMAVGACS